MAMLLTLMILLRFRTLLMWRVLVCRQQRRREAQKRHGRKSSKGLERQQHKELVGFSSLPLPDSLWWWMKEAKEKTISSPIFPPLSFALRSSFFLLSSFLSLFPFPSLFLLSAWSHEFAAAGEQEEEDEEKAVEGEGAQGEVGDWLNEYEDFDDFQQAWREQQDGELHPAEYQFNKNNPFMEHQNPYEEVGERKIRGWRKKRKEEKRGGKEGRGQQQSSHFFLSFPSFLLLFSSRALLLPGLTSASRR